MNGLSVSSCRVRQWRAEVQPAVVSDKRVPRQPDSRTTNENIVTETLCSGRQGRCQGARTDLRCAHNARFSVENPCHGEEVARWTALTRVDQGFLDKG